MSWILAFLGFVLLIVLHELGHFAVAKWVGMRVEKFSLFFPPTLASKRRGETEYAIGLIPAGGYVKISGMNPDEDLPEEVRDRAYHAQPVWKRIAVIFAGPAVNLILAFVLLMVFFLAVGAPAPDAPAKVSETQAGYPAKGKLQRGDTVRAVDGVRTSDPERIGTLIARHKCTGKATKGCEAATPARVVVERDGRERSFSLTPIYDPAAPGGGRTRVGFGYEPPPNEPLGFGDSLDRSADTFWFFTKATVELPARVFNAEQRKEISGVVGSYEVTRQTIEFDISLAIQILAIISLSLAIVNLFPFLPLDGGHIFWAVVEKIRRKPVPLAVMEKSGVIGFVLVIGIFLIGLTNDIGRIQGEGFGVP